MAMKIGDLTRGQGIFWRDQIWVIMKMEHVKPGKGPAYLQTDLRNPKTGQIVNNRFRPEETVEPVHFDQKKYEYLYSDGNSHVLMDTETYEQLELAKEHIGDQEVYLTPNCLIGVCSVQGEIITIELPNTVELKIEDTPPEVKGATATNQQKDAKCEGGAVIRVPPFIENGEIVRVDTRTGEYLGRA
ncbi:MAG: elongation factor P [Phycisphaerae bacterium]|nr:elongation factor P [Phycisphaerae bacterium]